MSVCLCLVSVVGIALVSINLFKIPIVIFAAYSCVLDVTLNMIMVNSTLQKYAASNNAKGQRQPYEQQQVQESVQVVIPTTSSSSSTSFKPPHPSSLSPIPPPLPTLPLTPSLAALSPSSLSSPGSSWCTARSQLSSVVEINKDPSSLVKLEIDKDQTTINAVPAAAEESEEDTATKVVPPITTINTNSSLHNIPAPQVITTTPTNSSSHIIPRYLVQIQKRQTQLQLQRNALKLKLLGLFSLLLLTDLACIVIYVCAFAVFRNIRGDDDGQNDSSVNRQELYQLVTALGSLHFWFCISLLQIFRNGLKGFKSTRREDFYQSQETLGGNSVA